MPGIRRIVNSAGRILIVTRNFPPLTGGMERLLQQVFAALAQDYEVALVGPAGSEAYADPVLGRCRPKPLAAFLACCVRQTRQAIKHFRPDLVFCGSGLTVLPVALATTKIPVVAYVHGLDVVADSWIYQRLFVPRLRGCARVIANSHYTAGCAQSRGVEAQRMRVIHPGVALPQAADRLEARRRLHLDPAAPVLLCVGRLTPRKGVHEFIAEVFPAIRAQFPDAVLLIVGEDPDAAVAAHGMGAALRQLIEARGLGAQVRMLGRIDDAGLAWAYAAADLHVFPVREVAGDAEGFGMVALEAAAYGVPTVAFAAGGVPDAVAAERSGWLLPPGDYAAFTARVLAYFGGGLSGVTPSSCRAFAATHSWAAFGSSVSAVCAEASVGLKPLSRSASL